MPEIGAYLVGDARFFLTNHACAGARPAGAETGGHCKDRGRLSLSHTLSLAHTHYLSFSHTLSHSLTLSLSHSLTLSLSHSLSLSQELDPLELKPEDIARTVAASARANLKDAALLAHMVSLLPEWLYKT